MTVMEAMDAIGQSLLLKDAIVQLVIDLAQAVVRLEAVM